MVSVNGSFLFVVGWWKMGDMSLVRSGRTDILELCLDVSDSLWDGVGATDLSGLSSVLLFPPSGTWCVSVRSSIGFPTSK